MARDLRLLIAVSVWAFVTACNGCLGCPSPVDQPGGTLPKTCDDHPDPPLPQKLDVLFVVDDSGSMKEEQDGVASEMTSFVSSLRVAGGVAQDIRVGVITTSVYRNIQGGLYWVCNPPGDTHYCDESGKLRPVPGTSRRVLNSSETDFVPAFAQLIQQGIGGSGQETPFEAMHLALSPPLSTTPIAMGGNEGFLRDGARLLIVVISDEDDCSEMVRPPRVHIGGDTSKDDCHEQGNSLTPVMDYYDFLTGLKDSQGNLKEVIYTVIGPVSNLNKAAMGILSVEDGGTYVRNIDCPTSWEPGYRHRQMAEMFFSDLANLDSICKPNYKDTLLNIANLAGVAQTLEVRGVSDENVLQVTIKRADGSSQFCTVSNGGISYEPPVQLMDGGVNEGRIHFESTCKRRRDDLALLVDRLCVF